MTSVEIIRRDGEIRQISCKGHAGYAEEGEDIVCAAISVLVTTCVNALEKVGGVKPELCENERTASIVVRLPEKLNDQQAHDAQIILNTVLQGLSDLRQEYPKYIRILDGRKSP